MLAYLTFWRFLGYKDGQHSHRRPQWGATRGEGCRFRHGKEIEERWSRQHRHGYWWVYGMNAALLYRLLLVRIFTQSYSFGAPTVFEWDNQLGAIVIGLVGVLGSDDCTKVTPRALQRGLVILWDQPTFLMIINCSILCSDYLRSIGLCSQVFWILVSELQKVVFEIVVALISFWHHRSIRRTTRELVQALSTWWHDGIDKEVARFSEMSAQCRCFTVDLCEF